MTIRAPNPEEIESVLARWPYTTTPPLVVIGSRMFCLHDGAQFYQEPWNLLPAPPISEALYNYPLGMPELTAAAKLWQREEYGDLTLAEFLIAAGF